MVSQEAARYISPLCLTQGHLKAVAWKERVNNFNSNVVKLLQMIDGMSLFTKVFPFAISKNLHYKRALLCEVHHFLRWIFS